MKIAVIGAGNGGQALSAVLAMRGHDVSLYNRSQKRILPILDDRKIRVEGESSGKAKLKYVGTDMKKAINGVEAIMVVVPAFAHAQIAAGLADCVTEGQIIVLNPGRTGGALEFDKIFREKGVREKVVIAEAQTFVFASRISGPGMVRIFRIKNAVPISVLPSKENEAIMPIISEIMPEFTLAKNVLYTSFNNIGAIFHPGAILMNAGWIETKHGDFQFYLEGISPSVARALEALDRERCEVTKTLGVEAMGAKEWLDYAYDVKGEDLYTAIHSNEGYRGIMAPISIENRYIMEDVPMSLVPISCFGKKLKIETKVIDSIINIAGAVMERDFWSGGRSLASLGVDKMSVEELTRYVEEGT
ncbi:MAG TPA: NAD/NADP octopine/nopaline dehydrogenase family protein [Mesotoga infera]|jgi:opine dehydrogenase|uniref:NAD/NADP-dependent octopine/nopaline dehydrogenase family protein n=1 Tax=unclassified Mesotoga TaxID=1184398 RepID=UPI000A4F8917|nr:MULTISPECIES: NAD/NADP-dependent octopine/nopaline dehydrogenase family protein [unclassified Mesotoga]PNQ05110.1 NADP transhydrogenase subunit alpha [Mesotoga sp. SC_NapDC3]PXF35559.1 NADP transhydrogenase subunit alpha [Mesotoga sp. SC_NapDC]HNR79791.1 NAD/NADP octopine/nopaline dehydrogenase family protein [Mesotoga infera]MDD3461876.1 NAD/NADP octopine/nopaline dehydrogenase family protein [Mesotoga sp.]HAY98253.1 NADP transhydrogenase subunit alpha [Mesotoga sp.]